MAHSPAAGAVAPTVVHTSNDGLDEGDFSLQVARTPHGGESSDHRSDATHLGAYSAKPAGASGLPIVVVIQEIFGLHEHIKDVVRRVAKLGYFAVAVDLYQRQGDAQAYSDIPTLIAEVVAKVPDEQVLSDLDASVSWAAGQGGDARQVGVTGFCWGGRLTWMYAAHNPDIKAGVAWYGKLTEGHGPLITRNPVDVGMSLNGPVLGLYAALDKSIPQSSVQTMRERLSEGNQAAQASELVVYPQADHAFFADYRGNYRDGDAADGWAKLTAWFARYLA